MSSFGKDYLQYWKEAVQKSVDGTIIAGPAVLHEYLKQITIDSSDRVLDLGCSFGRMHDAIAPYTSNVFGVDLELDVINEASKKNYTALALGKAESVPFPSNYFDGVVSWGVFDVVDQTAALHETCRILKKGGWLLFTGKNSNYHPDDQLAFAAERNAKLKDFPNQFTDLIKLSANLGNFGFTLDRLFLFSKRGDLGLNRPTVISDDVKNFRGYEYLLILKKVEESNHAFQERLTTSFSKTALFKAKQAGFENDIISFFRADKENESNN